MTNKSHHEIQKIDILWLIEHIVRELDVACMVKTIGEIRYDLKVKILPIFAARQILTAYDPTVIIIPYGFSSKNARLPELIHLWPEKIYFNLSWEEMYYNAYLEARAPNDDWSRVCIIHHAWGDFYKEYLKKRGVPDNHIFVNGHPAYMFYREPYKHLFKKKSELAANLKLNNARKWIFFPENYGWAFKNDSTLKKFVKYQQMKWEELILMRDYCRTSLKHVLKWIKELTETHELEFILRPRPATPCEDFKDFVVNEIGTLPANLYITNQASVREWILASDIVLSSISTSLIEAALAGKPAYMVETSPIPFPLQADWQGNSTRLIGKDEFFRVCSEIPSVEASHALKNWAENTLLSRGDALVNLTGFVAELCDKKGPAFFSSGTLESLRNNFISRQSDIKELTEPELIHQYHCSEQDSFSEQDIQKRTNRFKILLNLEKKTYKEKDGLARELQMEIGFYEWMEAGKPLPAPTIVKYLIVREYAKAFDIKILLETGTYKGGLIDFVKHDFTKIFSIELDHNLADKAKSKFSNYKHISIIEGDSYKILPELLGQITEPCLFWLDAHYSGGITAKAEKQTPIREELQCIFLHPEKNHVILIDDARCFSSLKKDYPRIDEVRDMIVKRLPGYAFEVKNDIIRAHPKSNVLLD